MTYSLVTITYTLVTVTYTLVTITYSPVTITVTITYTCHHHLHSLATEADLDACLAMCPTTSNCWAADWNNVTRKCRTLTSTVSTRPAVPDLLPHSDYSTIGRTCVKCEPAVLCWFLLLLLLLLLFCHVVCVFVCVCV